MVLFEWSLSVGRYSLVVIRSWLLAPRYDALRRNGKIFYLDLPLSPSLARRGKHRAAKKIT
jgi:hypothetical protein